MSGSQPQDDASLQLQLDAASQQEDHFKAPSQSDPQSSSPQEPQRTLEVSKRWPAQPGRQPKIVRPEVSHSLLASPSHPTPPKHHHYHQRSRSVNLSPVMRGGSFAPPSISPGSGVNLSLAWDNIPGMDPRKRASPPLNFGGPLRIPAARPGRSSSPTLQDIIHHSSPTSPLAGPCSRSSPGVCRSHSPEASRKGSRDPLVPIVAKRAENSPQHRSASPARAFALPVSPRLQAFRLDRMCHSSSSSNGSDRGSSGSASSPPPLQRPASPVPGPIHPDPEHAYDSIWPPVQELLLSVVSPSSSPNRAKRGPEVLHHWMTDRRSSSRSPRSLEMRDPSAGHQAPSRETSGGSSTVLSREAGPFAGTAAGHRRSLSGSSAGSPSSPAFPSNSSPCIKRQPTPEGLTKSYQNRPSSISSSLPRIEPGLYRAASVPLLNELFPPTDVERSSPITRIISPTMSSVEVDKQSVLAKAIPSGESPPAEPVEPSDHIADDARLIRRRSSAGASKCLSGHKKRFLQESHSNLERTGTSPSSPSPSPSTPSCNSALRTSPSPPPLSFAGPPESPPKTRSFIGMPPRSGYELSDDPDDVGSEDGTGSSVSSGGKEDSASATTDDEEECSQRERYVNEDDIEPVHRYRDEDENSTSYDDDREVETFVTDEEGAEAVNHRTSSEQTESGSNNSGSLLGSVERPHQPKRPSLTRLSVVPKVPSPTSGSARSLSQPSTSVLRYFRQEDGPSGAQSEHAMWRTSEGPREENVDGNDRVLSGITITDESEHRESAEDADFEDAQRDEESLSTLERIFLFAKSEMTYHRVIVSRSLPVWIREVELSEAVEYVIALLNGLATDDAEVCIAFASELHRIMWFYFLNCPLLKSGQQEGHSASGARMQQDLLNGDDAKPAEHSRETATRPRLPVGVFTPLICALLLNSNATVAQTAQGSLVSFFRCLRRTEDDNEDRNLKEGLVTHTEGREGELVLYDEYDFDSTAKQQVADELLEHVAFAIGRTPSHQLSAEAEDDADADANDEERQSSEEILDAPTIQEPSQKDDSSWDAEMQDNRDGNRDGNNALLAEPSNSSDDWRKGVSPFDSSSPVFSAFGDRADVDEEAAVGRMASVSLLGALSSEAKAVNSSTVLGRFLPEVLALQDDQAFYVRKEVAIALAPLSRHLSEEQVIRKLLPTFETLCQDKIWHVRQAAVTSLPVIFQSVSGQRRRSRVVSLMRSFISDVSRSVRLTALEIIGETIYLFENDENGVPPELLRFFLGWPFDDANSSEGELKNGTNESVRAELPSSDSLLFTDFGFSQAMHGQGMPRSGDAAGAPPWSTAAGTGTGGFGQSTDSQIAYADAERPLVMAYNFPAVVLTTGGAKMWPQLRQVHLDLSCDSSLKVRQSLAASLHEIAKLVGPAATEQDLLPVLDRFLMDEEDGEVKIAALENAHVVLAQLSDKSVALPKLVKLHEMWSTSFSADWRLREALALQIPQLADDFVLLDEEGCLMSIMQMALVDPVSSVRQAGVKATPAIYRNFAEHDQTVADGVLGMLTDMGEASAYRMRVGFLLAACALVDDPSESKIQRSSFQLVVLPRLLTMADDPVVDVRMALAKVVGRMCHLDELFAAPQSRSPELLCLLQTLAQDSSDYVRARVRDALDPDDPVLQATPRQISTGKRDLILGPVEGGPHRPEPEEDGDGFADHERGGLGEATPSSMMMMDFEDEDVDYDEDAELHMDEDQRTEHQQPNGVEVSVLNERDGDDDDDEDDIDSDLEMVNLDEEGDISDGKRQAQSDEHRQEEFHHFGNKADRVGFSPGNLLGFAVNGFDEAAHAGDESFDSTTSSDGDSVESSVLFLTSPERSRPSYLGAAHSFDGRPSSQLWGYFSQENHQSLQTPLQMDASRSSDSKGQAQSTTDSQGSSDAYAATTAVSASQKTWASLNRDDQAGQGDQPQDDADAQAHALSNAPDPFLSFVGSNLGGAGEAKFAKKYSL